MGIKKLLPTLRQLGISDWQISLQFDDIRGRRIAVDIASFFFSHQAISAKSLWRDALARGEIPSKTELTEKTLSSLEDYFNRWKSRLELEFILIFDGEADRAKTDHAGVERKIARERNREKARTILEEYRGSPSPSKIEKVSSAMSSVMEANVRHNSPEVVNFFRERGFACYRATGEAERLCVALQREDRVDFVLSKDTDCLVHGCRKLLTRIDDSEISLLSLDKIVEGLNLDLDQFLHFCLLLSCDYNSNIPGIGPKRSLKLLREYGAIENFPSEYDLTNLNLEKCLELFDQSVTAADLISPMLIT